MVFPVNDKRLHAHPQTPSRLRRLLLCSAAATLPLMLTGCSAISLLNGLVRSDTYYVKGGYDYGSNPRQKLDVYVPTTGNRPWPVVVFFYGGNWDSGKRADYKFVGEALASRGIMVVIPDYRLYPEVRYPAFIDDSAAAVKWTTDHIAEVGGSPTQVFLMGHSAGAYNAAMLALNGTYLRAAHVDAKNIRGLIGLAGPYDFLPLESDLTKAIFGFPNTSITTQPIHYASSAAPPALLITDEKDKVVSPGNTHRLTVRLQEFNVSVKEITYSGAMLSHSTLVAALATPLRGLAPVLEDVATFVHKNSTSQPQ